MIHFRQFIYRLTRRGRSWLFTTPKPLQLLAIFRLFITFNLCLAIHLHTLAKQVSPVFSPALLFSIYCVSIKFFNPSINLDLSLSDIKYLSSFIILSGAFSRIVCKYHLCVSFSSEALNPICLSIRDLIFSFP